MTMCQEFTLCTPSGQRVLWHGCNTDFAFVRNAFEPASGKSSQCLRLHDGKTSAITVSADGTWINYRQLYAVASCMTRRSKRPLDADFIGDMLFFKGSGHNVRTAFAKVVITYDNRNKWWSMIDRDTWFDATTATFYPIAR